MRSPDTVELRRAVLAVSVLDDLDVQPGSDGVLLPGALPVHLTWRECRRALAGHDPETEAGRTRLAQELHARR